jgi:hypothetical protein
MLLGIQLTLLGVFVTTVSAIAGASLVLTGTLVNVAGFSAGRRD